MNQEYIITLAGHTLSYTFTYPETRKYFGNWVMPGAVSSEPIQADTDILKKGIEAFKENSERGYVEYKCLINLSAKSLLKYGCCVFHAVSFIWRNMAWLVTGPSGVGKTTQYKNWVKSYPGEISMISGDMPVLERKENGRIWVHPSPWNGKERIGQPISAPLGGVFLLEHGEENVISRPGAGKLLLPILGQFIVLPDTEEQIESMRQIADSLFRFSPVWKLVNRGDAASTDLLRSTILSKVEDGTGVVHEKV